MEDWPRAASKCEVASEEVLGVAGSQEVLESSRQSSERTRGPLRAASTAASGLEALAARPSAARGVKE